MAELDYWIWFSGLRLRARARRALLDRFGDPRTVFRLPHGELAELPELSERELARLERRDLEQAALIVRRCAAEGVRVLTLVDPAYPERLSTIPDPPAVLYIKGTLPAVDQEPVFTLVGTRRSSPYGERVAHRLGYGLASAGGVVVSGLAEGVDSAAASGALEAGGSVIGVLGCAIDQVYPRWNGALYEQVAAHGALLSEYPPDTPEERHYFPERDRIMAALSLATVVVEAPQRSGALITAHCAADYGRDVFAVPANVDSANSRGCIQLLREGAAVAAEPSDVLSLYAERFPKLLRPEQSKTPTAPPQAPTHAPEPEEAEEKPEKRGLFRLKKQKREGPAAVPLKEALANLTENQCRIVGAIDSELTHVDDIVDRSGLPAAVVASELTMLTIKGYVRASPGKRFTLNIIKGKDQIEHGECKERAGDRGVAGQSQDD